MLVSPVPVAVVGSLEDTRSGAERGHASSAPPHSDPLLTITEKCIGI